MRKWINRLFTSDVMLYVTPWIFLVSMIAYYVITAVQYGLGLDVVILQLPEIIVVMLIPIAYKKHEKNLMKGLVGAALMADLLTVMQLIFASLTRANNLSNWIYFACILTIFVNHFIMSLDHDPKPVIMTISQIAALVVIINSFLTDFFEVLPKDGALIALICFCCDVCFAIIVVSVETRVNSFKEIRMEKRTTESAKHHFIS